jgi:hypothetical protein
VVEVEIDEGGADTVGEGSEGGVGVLRSGIGEPIEPPLSRFGKWRAGGEMVQELKDVIWKVGERRRGQLSSANSDGFFYDMFFGILNSIYRHSLLFS